MGNFALTNRKIGKQPNCDDSTFGTPVVKIGNDAAYFNGSSYLSIPDSDDWNFGSGDFTIDFWYNFSTISSPSNIHMFYEQITNSTNYFQFYKGGVSPYIQFDLTVSNVQIAGYYFYWTPTPCTWYHFTLVRNSTSIKIFINGVSQTLTVSTAIGTSSVPNFSGEVRIGSGNISSSQNIIGYLDELRISKGIARWTSNFTPETTPYSSDSNTKLLLHFEGNTNDSSNTPHIITNNGVSTGMGTASFREFQRVLNTSINRGRFSSQIICSTYPLALVESYAGGVLASNGDIHFVPYSSSKGQKVNCYTGVVSTYNLIYNTTAAYYGGVLAPNGDIHFIPVRATVGQKVSSSGVVSTYSLIYTVGDGAYYGGVLAPNGDIHFVPFSARVGQKVSVSGVVSTYSLVYTATGAYYGGCLAPDGSIHFAPYVAPVGQKISSSGVVSTYTLLYSNTVDSAYTGAVLSPNGDIHFVPSQYANRIGQKVSPSGVVSTYSLIHTGSHYGSAVAPNGDIHFVPRNIGQKIDINGVVSTYSLAYTSNNYEGGVLAPNGDIYFIPNNGPVGWKISTCPSKPLPLAVCMSPFLNKF